MVRKKGKNEEKIKRNNANMFSQMKKHIRVKNCVDPGHQKHRFWASKVRGLEKNIEKRQPKREKQKKKAKTQTFEKSVRKLTS